jgi:hypothetical protein
MSKFTTEDAKEALEELEKLVAYYAKEGGK